MLLMNDNELNGRDVCTLSMDNNELIGLEVCDATGILRQKGITNFKFVYYVDRKQSYFDKELVTAVRQSGDVLELVVCRYLFEVQ
ncbi:MAG: hypothetical protein NC132_04945 [Corallococcus sp.]|nr:hypothetical protein [Corallococcus sp.]MCM1359735.1 hypothetical protein [Corallococcus sp.]MCM1395444.1 hypothetical protein [Corallococcus sp.]